MTTISYIIDDDTRVELTFNRETITAYGYTWEDSWGEDGDDDYEPERMYMTSENVYSGYSASECVIKTLMNIGRVDDWPEGIAMIEEAGIEYVPSE